MPDIDNERSEDNPAEEYFKKRDAASKKLYTFLASLFMLTATALGLVTLPVTLPVYASIIIAAVAGIASIYYIKQLFDINSENIQEAQFKNFQAFINEKSRNNELKFYFTAVILVVLMLALFGTITIPTLPIIGAISSAAIAGLVIAATVVLTVNRINKYTDNTKLIEMQASQKIMQLHDARSNRAMLIMCLTTALALTTVFLLATLGIITTPVALPGIALITLTAVASFSIILALTALIKNDSNITKKVLTTESLNNPHFLKDRGRDFAKVGGLLLVACILATLIAVGAISLPITLPIASAFVSAFAAGTAIVMGVLCVASFVKTNMAHQEYKRLDDHANHINSTLKAASSNDLGDQQSQKSSFSSNKSNSSVHSARKSNTTTNAAGGTRP
jgi:hypothetical protein